MRPRRPSPHGLIAPIAELADVLEPDAPMPPPDFAFAPTEIAPDEVLAPPPSARAIVRHDARRPRVLWAELRHDVRGAREELLELWGDTEEMVGTASGRGLLGRLRFYGRRLVALWSFWHWDRMDLVRAAMIGIAVFLAAATFGSSTFGSSDAPSSTSEDLRTPRTPGPPTPTATPTRPGAR